MAAATRSKLESLQPVFDSEVNSVCNLIDSLVFMDKLETETIEALASAASVWNDSLSASTAIKIYLTVSRVVGTIEEGKDSLAIDLTYQLFKDLMSKIESQQESLSVADIVQLSLPIASIHKTNTEIWSMFRKIIFSRQS